VTSLANPPGVGAGDHSPAGHGHARHGGAKAPLPPADLRQRLLRPMPLERFSGWGVTIAVTLLAALFRFYDLGQPQGTYFDEAYYPRDAWDLIHHGAECDVQSNGVCVARYVVHPELGKVFIGVGQLIFGRDEVGWRVAPALAGTLVVLLMVRIMRRMTRSTLLGGLAGLLISLDGLELVQSRIGMLDIFLLFWVVAAFGCLVLDREQGRRRLVERIEAAGSAAAEWPGPGLGIRWWRWATGFCLGAALATKWDGLWFLLVFPFVALAWDMGTRSQVVDSPRTASLLVDTWQTVLAYTVVPAAVYVTSWAGWFATGVGWNRHRYGGGVVATVHAWLDYQSQMLQFHSSLETTHPYMSSSLGPIPKELAWLLLKRPVAYYYTGPKAGTAGCAGPQDCAREVLAIGNPAIWWVGIVAIIAVFVLWLMRRDWRMAATLAGAGAAILPWMIQPHITPLLLGGHVHQRTEFLFYALPALPFLVAAITLCIGEALGGPDAGGARRQWAAAGVGLYVLVVVGLFAFFLPILIGQTISLSAWHHRIWFSSWI
jgi:dolichyl-phosphate-mannose-protein mannosyltransferase